MGMIGNSLAQGLISGANIQDGTVDTPDLKDSAVTAAKIANSVIAPGKLSTGAPTWDTSGNVGVGVTPSAWPSGWKALQLPGLGSVGTNGDFFQLITNGFYNGTNYIYTSSTNASRYVQQAGQHQWYTAPSGTAGNAITFTQAMTLDASGNLLVGTTSATYSSSGRGVIEVNGSSNALISLKAGGTSKAYWHFNGTDVDFLANTGCALKLYSNGNLGATLDTSGNLLVGTTSNAPFQNLNCFVGRAPTGDFIVNHVSGTPSGADYLYFGYGGAGIGSITQNGTTGVLYNLTSDYRLKNNPVPVTGAKEFIMALQPKTWDWWDGSGKGVGFIAHEFMEVAKYSGHGEKDAVDEEGNIIPQSIQPSSSEVMANLVAHIQNLETRLAALETP